MAVGDITTLSYTGALQTFTMLAGKRYRFELYGAQGGTRTTDYYGGYGGYASGELQPTEDTVVNVYVGQQPTGVTGGYNGGGTGRTSGQGYGGGGATDIRIGGTALTDRKLVAGGGGGAGYGNRGGHGGGLIGGDASGGANRGYGGTQSAGGSANGALGVGGNATTAASVGAGGGGYYGGGAGTYYNEAGGGGSSYLGTMENTITVLGIKTGNGQAVITELPTTPTKLLVPTTYSYTGSHQFLYLAKGKYHVTLYGGQGANATVNGTPRTGGLGGKCSADITLDEHARLILFVGGQASGKIGGYNGGGTVTDSVNPGGGGGGASDIRKDGFEFANRLIVAAGGSGPAASANGASGGGLTGGDGSDGGYGHATGGTQSAGGATNGALGLGGNTAQQIAGGGGGGYYGGGGGYLAGSGGGGSSFYGSLENPETESGVNEGNGYIIIEPIFDAYNGFPQII